MATDGFFWFNRASAVRLAWRIVVAVLTGRFKYLMAIPYEKDGASALRFRVVTKSGRLPVGVEAFQSALHNGSERDINDSFLCPPRCPD